jgi:hypothetical protein
MEVAQLALLDRGDVQGLLGVVGLSPHQQRPAAVEAVVNHRLANFKPDLKRLFGGIQFLGLIGLPGPPLAGAVLGDDVDDLARQPV